MKALLACYADNMEYNVPRMVAYVDISNEDMERYNNMYKFFSELKHSSEKVVKNSLHTLEFWDNKPLFLSIDPLAYERKAYYEHLIPFQDKYLVEPNLDNDFIELPDYFDYNKTIKGKIETVRPSYCFITVGENGFSWRMCPKYSDFDARTPLIKWYKLTP